MAEVRPQVDVDFVRAEVDEAADVAGERCNQVLVRPRWKLELLGGENPLLRPLADLEPLREGGDLVEAEETLRSPDLGERLSQAAFVLEDQHPVPPECLDGAANGHVVGAVEYAVAHRKGRQGVEPLSASPRRAGETSERNRSTGSRSMIRNRASGAAVSSRLRFQGEYM